MLFALKLAGAVFLIAIPFVLLWKSVDRGGGGYGAGGGQFTDGDGDEF